MKKRVLAMFMALFLVFTMNYHASSQCNETEFHDNCVAAISGNYLKSYKVRINELKAQGGAIPVINYHYIFNKGRTYIFNTCSDMVAGGRITLEIYDPKKNLIFSNYIKKKEMYIPQIKINCTAAGRYNFRFSFEDYKGGCGIGVLGIEKM